MLKKGQLVVTKGIKHATDDNPLFLREVLFSLDRYNQGDWGDISDNDKEANDLSVENGGDMVLGAYHTSEGKIYIITEWDRSATTVLFAHEY